MLVCWPLMCVLTTHVVAVGSGTVSFGTYTLQHAGVVHVVGSQRIDVAIREPIFRSDFE